MEDKLPKKDSDADRLIHKMAEVIDLEKVVISALKKSGNGQKGPWWIMAIQQVGFPIVAVCVLAWGFWMLIYPEREAQTKLINTTIDSNKILIQETGKWGESIHKLDTTLKEIHQGSGGVAEVHKEQTELLREIRNHTIK
jgi:hypothetical protein